MKKQGVIIGIALAVCLLCACVYMYYLIRQQAHAPVATAAFRAIPPDAIVVQRFNSFAYLCDVYASKTSVPARFCAIDNGLSVFLEKLYAAPADPVHTALFDAETICSVHYTAKNTLHVLLAVHVAGISQEALVKFLYARLGTVVHYKKYNKTDILQLPGTSAPLYMAITEGFLVASTAPVVVESSVRHLVNGRSIVDHAAFVELLASSATSSESCLYLNFQQVNKIFTSLLGKRMQSYADFVGKSASWMALDGTVADHVAHMSGYLLADKGMGNFFSTVAGQPPAQVKLWEYVPASTLVFMSFSFPNFSTYRSLYGNYLEINKKDKSMAARLIAWEEQNQIKLDTWFESLYPTEVALAWLPTPSGDRWITMVRSQHTSKQPFQILPNPYSGAFSALFGSFFSKNSESHSAMIDNVYFFGDTEALEWLHSGFNKASSLYARMKQSHIRGKWIEEAGLTFMVQAGEAKESLIDLFDPRFTSLFTEVLSGYAYTLGLFQIRALEGKPYVNLLFSADTIRKIGSSQPLPMVNGSFKVYNHTTQKYDWLEQRPDSLLILKDGAGKQQWKSRERYAIADTVVQIDYLKNNKWQMLFASKANLHLLDRLGRPVAPYPRPLEVRVKKGPFVFDLKGDKEYQIFLIHVDNSLRLYDRKGAAVQNWEDFIPADRIDVSPIPLLSAEAYYWLLFGRQKDYILRADGVVAAVLQKSNRIKQDAPVELSSDGVLHATTTGGRLLTVQLNNGHIKTRKP